MTDSTDDVDFGPPLEYTNVNILKDLKSIIPCLEDWIKTTGHGEINKRDRKALKSLKRVIKYLEEIYYE